MTFILLLMLLLYVLGIGAMGMALLFFFSNKDKKMAVWYFGIGILLVIIGYLVNEGRPPVKGSMQITVESAEVNSNTLS